MHAHSVFEKETKTKCTETIAYKFNNRKFYRNSNIKINKYIIKTEKSEFKLLYVLAYTMQCFL